MCFRKNCVVQEGSFFFGTFYFRRWVYGEITECEPVSILILVSDGWGKTIKPYFLGK